MIGFELVKVDLQLAKLTFDVTQFEVGRFHLAFYVGTGVKRAGQIGAQSRNFRTTAHQIDFFVRRF